MIIIMDHKELYAGLKVYGFIYPPIYKIDGMIVNSRFYLKNPGWYQENAGFTFELCLNSGVAYTDSGNNLDDFCKLIDGLKSVTFDVLSGEFVNPERLTPLTCQKVVKMEMFHHPNIEMDYQDCCVCFESTITKTPHCKHSVCLRCIQQLTTHICPLCRGDISYRQD